ncbi:retrovirus-related pol polyprotein from transposon TNT 1-94 [Tanacetum coccineum]
MSATSSNHAKILTIHEASRECVWLRSKSGDIIVQKVCSSDNQADLFTKALLTATFMKLVHGTVLRRLNELNSDCFLIAVYCFDIGSATVEGNYKIMYQGHQKVFLEWANAAVARIDVALYYTDNNIPLQCYKERIYMREIEFRDIGFDQCVFFVLFERMYSDAFSLAAFPCLMLKKDNLITHNTVIIMYKVLDFAEKLLLRDADVAYGRVDDMKRLGCLNEPAVPHILKKPYALHEICVNEFENDDFIPDDLHDNKEDGPHIEDGKQKKRSKNRSTKNVVLDDDDCELIEESNLAFRRATSESCKLLKKARTEKSQDWLLASIRNQIVDVAGESAHTLCVGVINIGDGNGKGTWPFQALIQIKKQRTKDVTVVGVSIESKWVLRLGRGTSVIGLSFYSSLVDIHERLSIPEAQLLQAISDGMDVQDSKLEILGRCNKFRHLVSRNDKCDMRCMNTNTETWPFVHRQKIRGLQEEKKGMCSRLRISFSGGSGGWKWRSDTDLFLGMTSPSRWCLQQWRVGYPLTDTTLARDTDPFLGMALPSRWGLQPIWTTLGEQTILSTCEPSDSDTHNVCASRIVKRYKGKYQVKKHERIGFNPAIKGIDFDQPHVIQHPPIYPGDRFTGVWLSGYWAFSTSGMLFLQLFRFSAQ